jgi:tubulin monoglycylase TTLL3/8
MYYIQALLDRGWYHNADATSPYYDLKWSLRSIDVDNATLQDWQLTNHFLKNVAITTKVGLLKSLRNLVWLADVSMNDVIPRGYDLTQDVDMQAFIDDFRTQRAENLLLDIYR